MAKARDLADDLVDLSDPGELKAAEIRRVGESPEGSGEAADRAAPDAGTSVGVAGESKRSRSMGVDAARGVALVGMIAVHTYPEAWPNGTQSIAQMVAGGRTSALFALLAGVGIALMSGGQRPVRGRARAAADCSSRRSAWRLPTQNRMATSKSSSPTPVSFLSLRSPCLA
jgi:hypothetical protein